MEDLDILEKALKNLEATEASEEKASNFESLYKNWGKSGSQEERRKQLLENQKGYIIVLYRTHILIYNFIWLFILHAFSIYKCKVLAIANFFVFFS